MSDFASTFRQIIVPQLKVTIDQLCRSSILLGEDGIQYPEMHHAIVRHAIKRGALHLSDKEFADLRDWIGATILVGFDREERALDDAMRSRHVKLSRQVA